MATQPRLLVPMLLLIVLAATPGRCVSMLAGWPQLAGDEVWSSPALGDLDGDGTLEVVVGCQDGKVYAWHADGTPVAGWPRATGGRVNSSPALADLDGDGKPEVVIGSQDEKVYAWHGDGTSVTGWPQSTSSYVTCSPAVADLGGDGQPEVVTTANDGTVYAWHADGAPVDGWPQQTDGEIWNSPAVVDLNGDGRPEVVASTFAGTVYVWQTHGNLLPGWPQHTGEGTSTNQAIGDLDGDGRPEVVAASFGGSVFAWHADSTPVAGWPQTTRSGVWAFPVLADLDGDGSPEVIVEFGFLYYDQVYAWRADGTTLPGWPNSNGTQGYVQGAPAVGDLDGDGELEVLAGSYDGYLYAWRAGGQSVPGWPQSASDTIASSPALADLDGDGHLEVVVGCYDHHVYAWRCDTTTPDVKPWPMRNHDPARTGLYRFPAPLVDFEGTPTSGVPPLTVQFTDRSLYPPTQWSWSFGDGATSQERNPLHAFTQFGWYDVSLTAGNASGSHALTKPHYILVTFSDVPAGFWATDQILACASAGIVGGYPDGSYQPAATVTRDQMAVYVSRALAGGDANVPTAPATASFSDVGVDHWAFRYIEYCAAHDVVQGYPGGTYRPDEVVNRGQLAVYIARAMVSPTGDAAVPDPPAEATFPDVTAGNEWGWCYRHVEYCAAEDVVQGYWDGSYRPEAAVTRDQMAVYVARAFGLE
jgi:PKD repeat protein